MNRKILISVMILLVILPISSTDIFVASLPTMMRDLQCNISNISYTLSGYIVGFSLSILVSGALSDIFGRKPILLITAIIYALSSLAMSMAESLPMLIFLRILQGIGGGGGFVIARLIVKDYFYSKEQLNILSMLSTGNAIAPAIAPQIGNFVAQHFGWHSCFLVTSMMSILSIIMILTFLKETLTEKNEYNPLINLPFSLFKAFHSRQFIGYTLLIGLAWSAYFIFIGLSSFYFQNVAYYTAKQFSYVIIMVTCGYLIGTNMTRYFNNKGYCIIEILLIAIKICVFSTIVFVISILAHYYIAVVLSMFLLRLGIGIIMPTAQLGAMRIYNTNIGWYMGCLFFIEFLISGLLLSIAGHLEELQLGYGILSIISSCIIGLIFGYKLIKK
jgi:DHA1 family bicyclomycin/chloramphenicol resistance-like MFS transporter